MSFQLAAATNNVLAVLSVMGAAAPLVVAFAQNTVAAVEQTGKSGTDKMTAVLNAVEGFVNGIAPELQLPLERAMAAVEAFVNALVALWNEAGVFIHAVEAMVAPKKPVAAKPAKG